MICRPTGGPARVFEPKRELLALGIVVLLDVADGAPWSERTSVMVPADSGAGRPAAELLRGGTSDPAVVAIAGRFAAALDSVDLPPGPFL